MLKIFLLIFLLASQAVDEKVTSNDLLLTVNKHGGRCRTGECFMKLAIYRDGRFEMKSNNGDKSGAIALAEMAQLNNEINAADFAKIKAKKFTGDCPTAYDGQETTYTFYVKERTEAISDCSYAIDKNAPPFVIIDKLVASSVKDN